MTANTQRNDGNTDITGHGSQDDNDSAATDNHTPDNAENNNTNEQQII